ncbi:universal stress protein [Legionella tucsonensis]|uniref:Universal stress protein family protein n=1 Tax=Legionella tucsonensis TaxID=40335 RepID=A0A0W0ZQL1_9GAMM|nr:universal stress protein [Legionella tucsonensis]KTD71198.1 universal stress protein family protein [Legionella tucsonensis]
MSNRIIACIDGSLSSTAVCDWASWSSTKLDKPLTLLHALENPSKVAEPNLTGNIGLGSREKLLEELATLDEQRNKIALQQGKHLLEEALLRVVADNAKDAICLQRHGSLIEILQELEKETALLVIGRKGEQSEKRTSQIGSQLDTIIHTLHCPMLVTIPEFKQPKEVMITFDASKTAHKVLNSIIKNCQLLQDLRCHLVMVNKSSYQQDFRSAQVQLKDVGINVVASLLEGQVESTLSSYIEEQSIDLLIMGAYGHSRIHQFFVGSTTNHMLHTTKIPLLLIR